MKTCSYCNGTIKDNYRAVVYGSSTFCYDMCAIQYLVSNLSIPIDDAIVSVEKLAYPLSTRAIQQ